MRRITFIGAGSMVFARNLVDDMLSFDALADSEIVLMDLDEHLRPHRIPALAGFLERTVGDARDELVGARTKEHEVRQRARAVPLCESLDQPFTT